ncbi:mechanosensitive ion channel family protein [Jiulongibacter sp. NS-SX5]|uniref:mechanosensitive ion channel family protein n=1 Tax=Jiulongibacter sp. NS-SX5 TaxID=3463854 RepID=UPI00405A3A53
MNKLPNLKDILIQTFENLITNFSSFTSNFIGAAVILLVGWLTAKIASTVLKNVFARIGIDKIGDKINDIDAIKKFNLDIKLSAVVSKIVYFFIFLFFLITAADTLGVPAISNMFAMVVEFIPKVLAAAIMILVGLLLADAVKNFVVGLCESFNIASGKLIGLAVFFFLLVIVVIAALGQAGINTALLESSFNILIAGIILSFSIGYGFASKEILLNIISSFYSKNRYEEGQILEIDQVKGEVTKVDNTSITLKSGETETIFPLRVLQSEKIIVHKS